MIDDTSSSNKNQTEEEFVRLFYEKVIVCLALVHWFP
jgi:hypothetical protein